LKNFISGFFVLFILSACSVQKRAVKEISTLRSDGFQGYIFLDPETGETLLSKHAEKYFIPASTTKIFTLYASLIRMDDSLTAFRYHIGGDTLFVKGTSDPTFLNPNFSQGNTYNFLKEYSKISLNTSGYTGSRYGSGWMWDDAGEAYQTEISSFPIYGNLLTEDVSNGESVFFPQSFEKLNVNHATDIFNWEKTSRGKEGRRQLAFNTNDEITGFLLSDTLQVTFVKSDTEKMSYENELKSVPKDTVLRFMMYKSDNMLAEHMLLQAGLSLYENGITTKTIIDDLLKSDLKGLPHQPRWVDGSGLSRYNLFTPADLVFVVRKIYEDFGEEAIKNYFPHNGSPGTMENFISDEPVFLFAKSGSMSGVYNLAGRIKTDSGRHLIFAVMNNNFAVGVSTVREQTAKLLKIVKAKL
jgi:D-alanyl-D-alanine carboxypeptidase/D-alanyl-D-alanine-endopeptidase (penicillin-binding protein 4)